MYRLFLFCIVVGLVVSVASARPTYRAEFIGQATTLATVNNAGQAVGWRSLGGGLQAWVGESGLGVEDLPLPPGYMSGSANDINDHGIIVGSVATGGFPEFGEAARWTPDGLDGYKVDLLGALPGHTQSIATAINNLGDIVGFSITPGFSAGPAVHFNSPSGVENLTLLGLSGLPVDINDQRTIVGGRVRFDLDTLTAETLPVPEIDGFISFTGLVFPGAINNTGQVVGHGILATGLPDDQAIIRYTDDIGWEAMYPFATRFGNAYGINEFGEVSFEDGATDQWVHLADSGPYNLEDSLVSEDAGWLFSTSFGNDINDLGQIAAVGSNPMTGQGGFVLLSPVINGDFDDDGDHDIHDIDALVGTIAGGTGDPDFDLTGDGAVDAADLARWLVEAGTTNLPSGNTYLPGDADLDGLVGATDFSIWNGNKFQATAAWSQADFNADGFTDGHDLLIWNNHKFQSADVTSIPEPNSLAMVLTLLAIGFCALWRAVPQPSWRQ